MITNQIQKNVMKAIIIRRYASPEVLQYKEVETSQIKPECRFIAILTDAIVYL
ncbi:MAG: hypothetical protein ACKO11_16335 [Cuspidothrix sp.]